MFKKYPKIYRLGVDETDGILSGKCCVQEKIDGANASIWLQDGEIRCGSRNNDLIETGNPFNGFVEYAQGHSGIRQLLEKNPNYRLYGEWLVKHTIDYNEQAYKKFYLFDIECGSEWIYPDVVSMLASSYKIDQPETFGWFENPSEQDLINLVGKSKIGDKGEGIVIKNEAFVNKFGDHQYAKIVSESFKEDNSIVFGGNNRYSETYWEQYICNKYISLARVKKVIQKIESESGQVKIVDTPRISNTVYHDMLTEEIWDIQKKAHKVDFRQLKRICSKKAIKIFHDILNDSISIAY